nr:N-6 DNA methylase [Gammaproteobacteria bacterium]
ADPLETTAREHADLPFEAIVATPPFSADWSASAIHERDDRFSAYGRLAPKGKADFAFVQHMAHHLDSGATMACVLPHCPLTLPLNPQQTGFVRPKPALNSSPSGGTISQWCGTTLTIKGWNFAYTALGKQLKVYSFI